MHHISPYNPEAAIVGLDFLTFLTCTMKDRKIFL